MTFLFFFKLNEIFYVNFIYFTYITKLYLIMLNIFISAKLIIIINSLIKSCFFIILIFLNLISQLTYLKELNSIVLNIFYS